MTKFIEKLFDVECFITQTHSRDVFSVLGTLPKSMKAFFALLQAVTYYRKKRTFKNIRNRNSNKKPFNQEGQTLRWCEVDNIKAVVHKL